MLHPDVLQLKQFYASRLGMRVAEFICAALHRIWPACSRDAMLAVGYPTPYVEAYRRDASPLMVMMPAEQGAVAWPGSAPNQVVLGSDAQLPLQNNSINRALLVHSVEYADQVHALMQEMWRVLVPGGRMLVVVPNRVSFWSGSSATPFGFGRPFNALQLRGLLTQHQFTPLHSASALFAPPFLARFGDRLAAKVEVLGRHLWWFLGGVLIVEAEKQLYASITEPVMVRKPYRLAVAVPGAHSVRSCEEEK